MIECSLVRANYRDHEGASATYYLVGSVDPTEAVTAVRGVADAKDRDPSEE
jgi:hypothetical protein